MAHNRFQNESHVIVHVFCSNFLWNDDESSRASDKRYFRPKFLRKRPWLSFGIFRVALRLPALVSILGFAHLFLYLSICIPVYQTWHWVKLLNCDGEFNSKFYCVQISWLGSLGAAFALRGLYNLDAWSWTLCIVYEFYYFDSVL